MDESSEHVSAPYTVESSDGLRPEWQRLVWWSLRVSGAVLVVVADVGREDSFEVSAVDDQEPVEALAADGTDPPFDVGVRARRPKARPRARQPPARCAGSGFTDGQNGIAKIEDRNAAKITINFSDARKGAIVIDVNETEISDLVSRGTRQARRGRTPKN